MSNIIEMLSDEQKREKALDLHFIRIRRFLAKTRSKQYNRRSKKSREALRDAEADIRHNLECMFNVQVWTDIVDCIAEGSIYLYDKSSDELNDNERGTHCVFFHFKRNENIAWLEPEHSEGDNKIIAKNITGTHAKILREMKKLMKQANCYKFKEIDTRFLRMLIDKLFPTPKVNE